MKLFCSTFILFWVCYFLPNFTTSCSAEVKAVLTGTTGRKSTIIPATNTQVAWQHIRSCHITGRACISTLNLWTTHTHCLYSFWAQLCLMWMLTKDCMLLHLPSYKEMSQLLIGSTVAIPQPVSVLCVCVCVKTSLRSKGLAVTSNRMSSHRVARVKAAKE